MQTTLTSTFDQTFRKLLDAANLVQRLRDIEASPRERLDAHSALVAARLDAGRARAQLN